jgi:ribosome-associated protein
VTDQEVKSRSRLRREFLELKELGKSLSRLAESQLRRIPLSEGTREALIASQSMKRTALQRQYKYIAGLLAENEDAGALREAMARALRPGVEDVAAMHEIERWRDRLLAGEEGALGAFLERHPGCDRRRLARLVEDSIEERELDRPPKSARLLFRYMRECSG